MSAFPDSALDGAVEKIKIIGRNHVEAIYEKLLDDVQDYLIENAQYNIQSRLDMAERERKAAYDKSKEIEAENADLKSDVIAFCAPWAVTYARGLGLPEGHLHPTHYDILQKCGARMTSFTRAILSEPIGGY